MKTNKTFLFFAMILLFSSIVIAAPPFEYTTDFEDGLTIAKPLILYKQINVDNTFRWQVFNSTGLLQDNSTVYCVVNFARADGTIIYSNPNVSYSGSFYQVLTANNVTSPQDIHMGIRCQNYANTVGDFQATTYRYTYNGEEEKDSFSSLAIIIFVLSISLLLFYMGYSRKPFSKLDVTNFVLKKMCLTISVWLMLLNSSMILTIAANANLGLFEELFTYTWMFGWAGYTLIIFMLFNTLIKALNMWNINKKQRRFG